VARARAWKQRGQASRRPCPHEIGHSFGLDDAPCGVVGGTNDDYPLYEPYDTGRTSTNSDGDTVWSDARIGEYGVDIRDGTSIRRHGTTS
jgi:hypothetical protein